MKARLEREQLENHCPNTCKKFYTLTHDQNDGDNERDIPFIKLLQGKLELPDAWMYGGR